MGTNCGIGLAPHSGSGWVRFDGTVDGIAAYSGTVQQTITIPSGALATLSYYLKVSNVTAPSNSILTVSVGGAVVQTINEPAVADADYGLRMVDLSAFADGVPRLLSFNYSRPAGTSGSDVFLIDDAALGISCGATGATVTGRVLTASGLGLRNAVVSLTDSNGVRRAATTSSFGVFLFENVGIAQVYTIGVSSKRYRFATRSLIVAADLANVDFVGLE